jgi:hypothetical protein
MLKKDWLKKCSVQIVKIKDLTMFFGWLDMRVSYTEENFQRLVGA